MKRIIKQIEFELLDTHIEHPIGDSETIPGQSESIPSLLHKYQRGIMPPVTKQAYYEDNANLDFINPLQTSVDPLTTRQDMVSDLDSVKEYLSNIKPVDQPPIPPVQTTEE